ncbi:hypothetical protein IV203_032251 [Nitzschia inconspicua]|uniref:Uncharacterized protein n=1 Tax=Nitzschia inconspicua TaxID=303405 RepID=A0A9K3KJ73_9STRA|nr:hypothetical protein IV203_032251 [Nitzschia inconspicua]
MACAALTKTLGARAGSIVPEVDGLEELSAFMEASSPSTSPRFRPNQQIHEHPPVDSRPFTMHPKQTSIHNMYCEWHGISPFAAGWCGWYEQHSREQVEEGIQHKSLFPYIQNHEISLSHH